MSKSGKNPQQYTGIGGASSLDEQPIPIVEPPELADYDDKRMDSSDIYTDGGVPWGDMGADEGGAVIPPKSVKRQVEGLVVKGHYHDQPQLRVYLKTQAEAQGCKTRAQFKDFAKVFANEHKATELWFISLVDILSQEYPD